jgi:hypothetical protein
MESSDVCLCSVSGRGELTLDIDVVLFSLTSNTSYLTLTVSI